MTRQATDNVQSKPRWSIKRRLEFIDFRLYWDGRINRGDVVGYFGISVPQASADLSQYQAAANSNVSYDASAKSYVAAADFRPIFFKPSADQYLSKLRFLSSGFLSVQELPIVEMPSYSAVPILRRRLKSETLRRLLDAIRSHSQLHVQYQSVSRAAPVWRWIAPHALGFDGFRWHARAWCPVNESFRDFVIARMLKTGTAKPVTIDSKQDIGWRREITLKVAPHPRLSAPVRRAIELDYGMKGGFVGIKTRVCLSYYVERNLGLDYEATSLSPERQQIVLLNREEVDHARQETESASKPWGRKERTYVMRTHSSGRQRNTQRKV
jgi:hypothetical protein